MEESNTKAILHTYDQQHNRSITYAEVEQGEPDVIGAGWPLSKSKWVPLCISCRIVGLCARWKHCTYHYWRQFSACNLTVLVENHGIPCVLVLLSMALKLLSQPFKY